MRRGLVVWIPGEHKTLEESHLAAYSIYLVRLAKTSLSFSAIDGS